MKATVKSNKLKKSLSYVIKSIQIKPNIPVLSNVLIELKDGNLTLASTNLEMSVKVWIPAMIEIEGTATVSAKYLYEYVAALNDENVLICLENNQLHLQTDKSNAFFNTIDASEFPILPEVSEHKICVLDTKEFYYAINKVLFAISNDYSPSKMAYTGVFIEKSLDTVQHITMVGLDTFRLSLKEIPFEDGNFEYLNSLLIPGKHLIEIAKILVDLEDEPKVSLFTSANKGQIIFKNVSIEISIRLIDAQYPNYKQIIPSENPILIKLNKTSVESAIRIMSAFTKDTSTFKILVDIDNITNKIVISSLANEIGRNEITLDLEKGSIIPPEGFKTAYFLKNFSEAIAHISGDSLSIETKGPTAPCVIKDIGDDKYIHLLMPVRREL